MHSMNVPNVSVNSLLGFAVGSITKISTFTCIISERFYY